MLLRILYNFNAFLYVVMATFSNVVFLISAIFFAVYLIFLESFLFPLLGSGLKYGQSVSIKILSSEDSVSFGYIKRSRDNLSDIAQEFISYLKEEITLKESE